MTQVLQTQGCALTSSSYNIPPNYSPPDRDLRIDGVEMGEKIVVAMSGGVDSSVVAALMHEIGYQVIGLTLQLYDHGAMLQKKGACCAGQDIYDAKNVAQKLGFSHYVLNYESLFKQNVMDDFADAYLRGETPIPCVRCNQKVKFQDLLQTAKDLGAKAMVTGHYVKRVLDKQQNGQTQAQMHQAFDKKRDQSYFLFTTTQEQLNYLRFPLGLFDSKLETRYHAKRFNLKIFDKPDSQDICFVPNGNYASVVNKLRPGALDPGYIKHIDGTVLGKHDGIINYTIGQRKGIGVAAPEPLYVVRLDAASKEVIVGPKEALAVSSIFLKDVNWLADFVLFEKGYDCFIKIRSSGVPIPVRVKALSQTTARVDFDTCEYGVAFGQAGVFYEGERLLGGGWITSC